MTLLQRIAEALGTEPGQAASQLGLSADGDDAQVAAALAANAQRVKELEARPAPPVSAAVANALGVAAEADETAVKAAVIRLKAGAALAATKARLGLQDDATEAEVVNAIAALQEAGQRREAEDLVDRAMREGRVAPAQREFWMHAAEADFDAARQAIHSLPVICPAGVQRRAPQRGGRRLDEAELAVCRQLGLSSDAFLKATAQWQPDSKEDGR